MSEDPDVAQGVVFPPHFPDGFGQKWSSEGDLIDKLVTAYGEEVFRTIAGPISDIISSFN